jgi:co-chaperonin GroES (HSP10)
MMQKEFGLAVGNEDLHEFVTELETVMKRQAMRGYRLLIRAPVTASKTTHGFEISQQTRDAHARHADVGKVIGVGPLCYMGEHFQGLGDWVKEGDWVDFNSYDAHRKEIMGHVCYYLNDNRVFSVIPPENYPYFLKGI